MQVIAVDRTQCQYPRSTISSRLFNYCLGDRDRPLSQPIHAYQSPWQRNSKARIRLSCTNRVFWVFVKLVSELQRLNFDNLGPIPGHDRAMQGVSGLYTVAHRVFWLTFLLVKHPGIHIGTLRPVTIQQITQARRAYRDGPLTIDDHEINRVSHRPGSDTI